MTIQQHASFDSSAAELNATSKLVKAWESKNAKNAAKAGGISLMALSLAACGGSSTTTAVTPVVDTPVVDTPVVDAATSQAFTANLDNLKGGSGDDSFNGVYYANGGTGTTAFPGDAVDGGAGADTLNISVAGLSTAAVSINAIRTSNVETVLVTNYDTNATAGQDTTIDTSLMSGIVNVGLNASSAVGDTIFTGMTSIVGASMANGAGDLTLTYTATPVAGTADTQAVTVSNLTAGTFTANGAETIAIDTALAKSTLTNVASDTLKTLDIGGDQALTISTALTNTTIDASDNTGGVTLTLGANAAHVVKGGSGADTIDAVGTLTSTDTLTGGSGEDVLKLTVGAATIDKGDATTKGELYNVSGFEKVDIASTADTATLNLKDTDITSVDLAANARDVVITTAPGTTTETISFVLNGVTYTTAAVGTNSVAASAAAIATTIDALSGFNASSSSGTLSVTATSGEAVEINTFAESASTTSTYTVAAVKDVTVTNIGTQTLNVYSADAVTASLADASGTADSLTINLATRAADDGFAKSVGDITANNIETINMDATGMDNGKATTVAAVKGNAMATLNITGDSDVTISSFATSAKLATINASTSTGDISLAAAPSAVDQTITTGGGNDTITMGALLTDKDVIDAGGNNIPLNGTKNGSDTVTASGNIGTVTSASALQIANAEAIDITNAGAAATYIDAAKITGTTTMSFSGASGTVALTNLGANHTVGAAVAADEFDGTLSLTLADATGTDDSVTVDYGSGVDAGSTVALTVAAAVETVNLVATTESGNATTHTVTNTNNAATNIVVTKGVAEDTVALGTLNAATTNVDAGAANGNLTVTTAAAGAVTVSAAGDATNASSITTGAGNDTITLTGKSGTLAHTVNGGAGTGDVLNVTLSALASDFTNVSNVETINITVGADTDVDFNNTTKDNGLNAATTVNILGGDSLSSFKVATAVLDDDAAGTTMTLDASTFGGAIDIAVASDAFDAELTIKGGALATDKVSAIIADVDNKIAAMTGVETLTLTSTNADVAAKADLTNATGLVTVDAQFANAANADQISIAGLAAGVKVKTTSTETGDNLVLALADATGTSDSMTLEVTATNTDNDVLNIDAAGIETLAITNKDATTLDLAGLTATGTGTSSVTIAGAGASILNGINATTNSIDATTATGGLTLAAAQRTGDAKTIKGGEGADSLAMENAGDTMAGGLGTNDTLVVSYTSVMGGISVDLTAADQITTFDGAANATAQTGFENVDLSAYANNGAVIVGAATASTITGTAGTDNISSGKGDDTIIVATANAGNNDIMDGGAGTGDTLQLSAAATFATDANLVNIENVTVSGTSTVVFAAQTEDLAFTGASGVQTITGGQGADTFTTGTGIDIIDYTAAGQTTTATTFTDTAGASTISTVGMDIIVGAGDKIDLSALGTISAVNETDTAVTTAASVGASADIQYFTGNYDAATNLFTSAADASASDLLVAWDNNGTTAGTTYEVIIITGASDLTLSSDVATIA